MNELARKPDLPVKYYRLVPAQHIVALERRGGTSPLFLPRSVGLGAGEMAQGLRVLA